MQSNNPTYCGECACRDFSRGRCVAAPGLDITLTRSNAEGLPLLCPIKRGVSTAKRSTDTEATKRRLQAKKELGEALERGASEAEIRNLTWEAFPDGESLITAPKEYGTSKRAQPKRHEPDADENWMPALLAGYADMHPDEDL